MWKKKIRFILLLGLSVTLFISGTAYGMTSTDVAALFKAGAVSIHVSEYEEQEGIWVTCEDEATIPVVPGQHVSRLARIKNDGADCYVRVRFLFNGAVPETLNAECLTGMDTDRWTLADDGYYYYRDALSSGAEADIFSGIRIPEALPDSMEGGSFYLTFAVDALQSANFEPRYDTASPWGNVEILKFEKEGSTGIGTFEKPSEEAFRITYEGDAENLVTNDGEFFSDIPYLMPGDSYSDTLMVSNPSGSSANMHFRCEAGSGDVLLEKIHLQVKTADSSGEQTVVYDGSMEDAALAGDVLLGRVAGDMGMCAYTFTISVPSELNNQYALTESSVRWVFSAEKVSSADSIEKKEPLESNRPVVMGYRNSGPKTGDTANMAIYICMMLSALTVGMYAVWGLRKGGGEDA